MFLHLLYALRTISREFKWWWWWWWWFFFKILFTSFIGEQFFGAPHAVILEVKLLLDILEGHHSDGFIVYVS